MSEEERILRLENAFTTLSELAARSQEVDTQHEARLGGLEESNRRIAETNRDLAKSNQLIVEMLRRHDERLDEFHAAREETGQKIGALVDAQIRIEEAHSKGMEELRASLAKLAEAMKHLAESQAHTDRRLDALADIVRKSRNGRGRDDS